MTYAQVEGQWSGGARKGPAASRRIARTTPGPPFMVRSCLIQPPSPAAVAKNLRFKRFRLLRAEFFLLMQMEHGCIWIGIHGSPSATPYDKPWRMEKVGKGVRGS